jgi:hypothetical protein
MMIIHIDPQDEDDDLDPSEQTRKAIRTMIEFTCKKEIENLRAMATRLTILYLITITILIIVVLYSA